MGLLERLISVAVPLSFGSPGHALRKLGYDATDLDVDLSEKIAVVTGANSGIGFATTAALAARGARVVMACRSAERGQAALDSLRQSTGSDRLELAIVDLSSLGAVRRFCDELDAEHLDILVHNAASVPQDKTLSEDGIELSFATNLVGPFLMTAMLAPRLQASADARVIFVSSGGMYLKKLELDDWAFDQTPYDPVLAYANEKRALVVVSELFADRFRGASVTFNAMHPGWADTPIVEHSLPVFHALTKAILRTPVEAADTVIWLAAARGLAGTTGKFWFDREPRRTHLVGWTRESAEDRSRLWDLLARLARVDGDAVRATSQLVR